MSSAGKDLVPIGLDDYLVGEDIEIIVRYKGIEYTAGEGKVRQVSIHRNFEGQFFQPDFGLPVDLRSTDTVSIVLERGSS